jgi:hypothetical protein
LNEELDNGKFSTPYQFATKAVVAGYRWVCYEWYAYNNASRGPAMLEACASSGLVFTIWLTRPFDAGIVRQACLDSRAAGISLEAEIPGFVPEAVDWQACVNAIADLPIAKSVVTNFAPFVDVNGYPDPAKSKPLVDAGWACLTEAYLGEAPNATPENLDFYARAHLGWTETQPVLGIYGGKTLADYPTRGNYRNWSCWDAGEVLN